MTKLTLAGGLLVALALSFGLQSPAGAQAGGGATVVSGVTCPTSTSTLNVGNNRPLIETQNGQLCTQVGATTPSSAGGVSNYSAPGGTGNALLTNSPVRIGAAGAHSLYGVALSNPNTADTFCQAFDKTSVGQVTLGTTVPDKVFRVPGGSSSIAGSWEEKFTDEGRIAFANGIILACTTTATGSTAPTTGISGELTYK